MDFKFLVGLLILCLPHELWSQKPAFISVQNESIPYRILSPPQIETAKKYPLVLFFHGAGERGRENLYNTQHIEPLFLQDSNQFKFPCFVIAPQCDTGYRWVETDWTLEDHIMPEKISVFGHKTMQLLEEIKAKYPIDSTKIYLMGLSMGGFACWDFLSRFPNDFAAAVPICGGADLKQIYKIKRPAIWIFHGAKDKLVSVIRSRKAFETIQKVNAKVKYTEYPELGHGSWIPALKEKTLLPWLFSQQLLPE